MDSFFGIGVMELFVIAVIALVVLGPERLPGAMRSIANFVRQLRSVSNEFSSQFSDEIKMLDEINPRRIVNEVLDPVKGAAAKPAAKPAVAAKPAAAAKPAEAVAEAANTILTPVPGRQETSPPAESPAPTAFQPSDGPVSTATEADR